MVFREPQEETALMYVLHNCMISQFIGARLRVVHLNYQFVHKPDHAQESFKSQTYLTSHIARTEKRPKPQMAHITYLKIKISANRSRMSTCLM